MDEKPDDLDLLRPRTRVGDILGYVPPELHDPPSGWYIDYYARHPQTRELKRKRVKINRVKGEVARKVYPRHLIAEITRKLQSGWTPWTEGDIRRPLFLSEALNQWDRVKQKQLRHSSPYSYTSMTSVFREWCTGRGLLSRYAQEFTRNQAHDFLQWLSDERGVGNRTYNNYVTYCGMVFTYCAERGIVKENPFTGIRKLKAVGKSRTYLNEEDRVEMVKWISVNDEDFLLPCVLVFGALVRPAELRRLRVHHVDLERQVITLPAELTKSGIERTPAIPNWMIPYFLKARVHQYPSNSWLVGARLCPGSEPIARNTLNRHWVRMRNALQWPVSKQLYSLRDTGIIQLIRDGVCRLPLIWGRS